MKRHSKRSGGFTLVETLVTVAILVILLGLSLVGAAYYKDYLKITELDNAARDIYMAAENRAVLLQNSGQLRASAVPLGETEPKDPLTLTVGGITAAVGTVSSADADLLKELLPLGTIDPALRTDGHSFFILYDQATGHVEEVFYAEGEFGPDLVPFRSGRPNRVSYYRGDTSNRRLVGWYNAEAAANNVGTKPLPTPGVEVLIENGGELTVTVRYSLPSDLPEGVERKPKISLEYGGGKIDDLMDLLYASRRESTGDIATDMEAEYTWVLDSLDDSGGSRRFKDLGLSPAPGGNFTVTAGLTLSAAGYVESAYYAQDAGNSLFAGETGDGTTAYIANLRHLQNLHPAGSGVRPEITAAVQLCDIDCTDYLDNKGEALIPGYEFTPIVNERLHAYDGGAHTLEKLNVSLTGNAGLFGIVSGGMDIRDLRLLSPSVTNSLTSPNNTLGNNAGALVARVASGSCTLTNIEAAGGSVTGYSYAGGLVGVVYPGASCTLDGCRVYWEHSNDLKQGTAIAYKVRSTRPNASCAGGLIGCARGSAEIRDSFAATTVEARAGAGGLVGQTEKGITVRNSYAGCYLKAGDFCGGLIGRTQETAGLTNCYAAGFIMDPADGAETAGLVNGAAASTPGSYSYSVARVLKGSRLERPPAPLTEGPADTGAGLRYVYMAKDVKPETFGGAFGSKTKGQTHVYNLLHKIGKGEELKPPYPFPGLTGLDHYGDWAELNVDPVPAGLAYYETYSNAAAPGVEGFYESLKKFDTLKKDTDNPVVSKDGYALVFKGEAAPSSACMITYNAQEWTLSGTLWSKGSGDDAVTQKAESFPVTLDNAAYTLVPLPDEITAGELPGASAFFQKLDYQGKLDGTDKEKEESKRSFYFNPHFAKTVTAGTVTVETEGAAEKVTYTPPAQPSEPTAETNPVYVRTARHLYDLSAYQNSYVQKSFHFAQELDIDYASYTGYPGRFAPAEKAMPFRQAPIGSGVSADSPGSPFLGVYDGGCHIIRNVFFQANGSYLGLFGLFGKNAESTLKNVVYEMDPAQPLSVSQSSLSLGALVGKNYGTVENCAVYGVNMSAAGRFIGGLVGYNQGSVTNCAAEAASLTAGLSGESPCAGGLVGCQNGAIANSYAVGKLVLGSGSGSIAGLLGSGGKLQNSYAAVDLVGSEARYGLCGSASVDGKSGWLKDVFVYRGTKYNITATTDYQDSGRGFSFKTLEEKLLSPQLPAGSTILNIPDGAAYGPSYEGKTFPYHTGVKTTLNRNSKTGEITGVKAIPAAIHYGLWPLSLPVGLAYYETYSDGTTCLSGQYETVKIMTLKEADGKPVVAKDGYALLFEGEEGDIPVGGYAVQYGNTSPQQSWTLTKTAGGAEGEYVWKDSASKEQKADFIKADGYTLIPLPDKTVTGQLSEGDAVSAKFHQKLVYGEGLDSSRTFYFNPHFAGRIIAGELVSVTAGTVTNGVNYTKPSVPAEPVNDTSGLKVWAATCGDVDKKWGQEKNHAISVRTPRHLYALSCFQNTYVVEGGGGKKYYFKQELDLDYNSYGWYGEGKLTKSTGKEYYEQVPIGRGTGDDGFKGAYNGGGHTIRNVFYTAYKDGSNYNILSSSQYIGLFRYVEYISNVNYEVPGGVSVQPENKVAAPSYNSDLTNGIKVGTLMGGCFRASNCTATLLGDFTVKCNNGTHVFIGGLSGYSNKMDSCHAEVKGCLKFDGTTATVYAGGLQGLVYQEVVNCTSKVNSLVVAGGTNIYAGGLLGGIAFDSPKSTTRVVAGCATEVKGLRVTAGGTSYAGGLIGYNGVGGSIYASYAVGAMGAGDTSAAHHYSGLVGRNENKTVNENGVNVTYKFQIQHCYSAVGLPSGSTGRNYNFCPDDSGTIKNCFYLAGTWTYGGKTYTALPKSAYGIGQPYGELVKSPDLQATCRYEGSTPPNRKTVFDLPGMRAGGDGYPFPTGSGNDIKVELYAGATRDNEYELVVKPYPGDDWPKNPA